MIWLNQRTRIHIWQPRSDSPLGVSCGEARMRMNFHSFLSQHSNGITSAVNALASQVYPSV